MKLLIILLVIVILLLSACSVVDTCDNRCKKDGFSSGKCLSGGSATGSGCDFANGTQPPSFDRDNPIFGCDRESIGSWDECCCFN